MYKLFWLYKMSKFLSILKLITGLFSITYLINLDLGLFLFHLISEIHILFEILCSADIEFVTTTF